MANFHHTGIFEDVYGDDLDKPIDNSIRYPDWIQFHAKPIIYEKYLGTTFHPKSKTDHRLKRYQDQVQLSPQIKKINEFRDKANILINYIPENHFNEICHLASHLKNPIKKKELIPTLLALYELKMFVESKILLNDRIFKEIIDEYYQYCEKKHKYTLKEIRSATIYFFHNLAKFVRDLYDNKGILFDNSSLIVKMFSEAVRSFIDTYIYDTLGIAEIQLDKIKTIPSDHYQAYKAFITPKIFLKIILAMHVKQDFQEIAFKVRKQQISTVLSPEDLESLGRLFFNQYLSSSKNIKSSYGICLTIIRELDKSFADSLINELKLDNFLQTYHNIKIRHRKFIEILIKSLTKK